MQAAITALILVTVWSRQAVMPLSPDASTPIVTSQDAQDASEQQPHQTPAEHPGETPAGESPALDDDDESSTDAHGNETEAGDASTDDEAGLTEGQQQDLALAGPTLLNPSADVPDEQRVIAAKRLLSMNIPEAIDYLHQGLASDNQAIRGAVVAAMEASPAPVQELLIPAADALRFAEPPVRQSLILVLSRYGAPARQQVATIARDQTLPVQQRLGPIEALSIFRSRESTAILVDMLDPQADEPAEISDAVCASLEQITGVPHGNNAQAWREWWVTARDQPSEKWLTNIVQQQNQLLADLQREQQRQQEQIQRIESRLIETYQELFRVMPVEEQSQRLAMLLDDELEPVRRFAVQRIEKLLRDQNIPRSLQDKLASRLADPSPAIRRQALVLLDQLNYSRIGALLVSRLEVEADPDVTRAILNLLAKRPQPEAAAGLVELLGSQQLSDNAAEALFQLLVHGRRGLATVASNESTETTEQEPADEESSPSKPPAVTGELREHMINRLQDALAERPSPALLRLACLVYQDDELEPLVTLLDAGDDKQVTAVANGLAHRPLPEPLIERAERETIFPYAARALSRSQPKLVTLRALLDLSPHAPELRQVWLECAKQLIEAMDPATAMEADDVLAELPDIEASWRIERLVNIAQSPTGNSTLSAAQRVGLTTRLAELYLSIDQPQQAHDVLQALNGMDVPEPTRRLRFVAAVKSSHFDIAQRIEEEPEAWVALLGDLVDSDPERAQQVREEINQRFNGRIEGELAAALAEIDNRLPPRSEQDNNGPQSSADAGSAG